MFQNVNTKFVFRSMAKSRERQRIVVKIIGNFQAKKFGTPQAIIPKPNPKSGIYYMFYVAENLAKTSLKRR